MKGLWTTWKYAIGSFSDDKTKPYDDRVVWIRTFWVLVHLITCFFIIAHNGVKIGWF